MVWVPERSARRRFLDCVTAGAEVEEELDELADEELGGDGGGRRCGREHRRGGGLVDPYLQLQEVFLAGKLVHEGLHLAVGERQVLGRDLRGADLHECHL